MQVALTWDLMVIIFFIVIMSYSYIVGQNGTIKIILSSYIAMLAANGLGNLLAKYIHLSQPIIKVFDNTAESNLVIFKIFTFIVMTLILVLRGGFIIDMGRQGSMVVRLLSVTIFGFLSAGLMMSTILVFIAGSAVDGFLISTLQEAIKIPTQTLFVRSLIDYYNFWFAAPAIAFVLLSVMNSALDEGPQEPPLVQ
jgi:hypothetical protein